MENRKLNVELFDLQYKVLLMPMAESNEELINTKNNIPNNTIVLRLTKTGKVAAYLPSHHHHTTTPAAYIELTQEELSQLPFPNRLGSSKWFTEKNAVTNKVTSILGCSCNFLDFYDKTKKELSLSRKNLTIEAIPALCNFLQAYPEIEILDISSNPIGKEGKKLLAKNNTLKKIVLFDTNFDDEDAITFSKNTNLATLNVVYNSLTLKGLLILADSMIEEIYCANNTFSHKHLPILNESNPLERARYGRKNGISTEVPPLTKLCLFSIKEDIKKKNQGTEIDIEIPTMPSMTMRINKKRI